MGAEISGQKIATEKPAALSLTDRGAVLVTGASTGIGRACAEMLAAMGHRVFTGVRREEDSAALAALSPRIVPVMLDVTQTGSIQAALAQVSERLADSSLVGLVNNAGTVFAGPLEMLPLDVFRQQLEINVTGQLAVTQAFLPLLRASGGRIVNMGSISGLVSFPCSGAYAASKFALEAVTDALRQELKPFGVEVSIIEPGAIATPIWGKGVRGAERYATEADPALRALYESLLQVTQQGIQHSVSNAAHPEAVARLVAEALHAKNPKTRYRVGPNANMVALMRLLPDRLRDWMVASKFRKLLKK